MKKGDSPDHQLQQASQQQFSGMESAGIGKLALREDMQKLTCALE